MNVAIITTVRHNVGDDFVREGIAYLLARRFGDCELSQIHKHVPVSVRNGLEGVRRRRLGAWLDKLPLWVTQDKILEAQLVVQSGAPVYWCNEENHCGDSEWFGPLIERRYMRIRHRVPLLNLAAGTCQRYHSDGSEVVACPLCSGFIREFFNLSRVTTVRDHLSRRILLKLGLDAPVIPCTSIFARDRLHLKGESADYVALNYMVGGAHYDFGQNIDRSRWERVFRAFYEFLSDRERCVFVCHSPNEVASVQRFAPEAETFYSTDHSEYLRFYSRAKFGIMNRVHGAFAIASYGRPSFIVGNDTRARMGEEIGLRHAFVEDVDANRLMEEYEYLKSGADSYRERFEAIKERAYNDYMSQLDKI